MLLKLIRLVYLILIWFQRSIIRIEFNLASWFLNLSIFLHIFWKNNLSFWCWIVSLVLDIIFQIYDASSPNIYQFIFWITFGSEIFISLDQDDQSFDAIVAVIKVVIPCRKSIFYFLKRRVPWINFFCRIKSNRSGN